MIPVRSNSAAVKQATAGPVAPSAPTTSAVVGTALLNVVMNSAEELTQALSGKVQERKLKERKLSDLTRSDGLDRDQVEESLEALFGEASGQSQDQSRKQVDEAVDVLSRQIARQPALARQFAKEHGGDATEQYLLLTEVAERFKEGKLGPDPGQRAESAAREAAADLLAERGREIRADLNTLPALSGLGADAPELRSNYRDVVFGEATVADFMRKLLERVPDAEPEKFNQALDAARDAAGLDLAAARPSGDPVRLQALITDLNHMKVIGTVMEQCGQLSQSLASRHEIDSPPSAARITRELVAVTADRWVDANRFNRMVDDLGLTEPATASVEFLTAARTALRDLPVQVYGSPEARETVLDAAQGALDHAIDREEGYA
jgi:type III secretion protein W